jgi:hypothetical protein
MSLELVITRKLESIGSNYVLNFDFDPNKINNIIDEGPSATKHTNPIRRARGA